MTTLAQSALDSTGDAVSNWQRPMLEIILGRPAELWMQVAWGVVVIAAAFLPFVLLIAMFCIWWERKVAGHIQSRLGPNRVGPFGLLQSLADGLKLIAKEDLCPKDADKLLFRLAPYIAFAPAFAAFLALPFGPNMTFEPRLSAGVFWILAILSVEVMGVILAGWASNNKWAVYGAMREACQMVSYEIPLGISIIIGVMTAGSLNLLTLGHIQGGGLHTWLVFRNPFVLISFFVYFVASLASNKRAPFDLPESESELVAGFHTEYSGMRFAFFFFAEYAAMFVVGGIQAALFLGSWHDPFGFIGYKYNQYVQDPGAHRAGLILLNIAGLGMFTAKALGIIFVQMWLRWTLPRPRIDQVLYACVKVLLPFACVLLLGAALWELFLPGYQHKPGGSGLAIPWRDYNPFYPRDWADADALPSFIVQVILMVVGLALFAGVIMWILYAIATGRGHKQRLTDPAPIPEPA
jgi:NADH-quinone oxidoreductase subunit H